MLLRAHAWPITEHYHNQCVFVCVFLCRNWSLGVNRVTGSWFPSAIRPCLRGFDVLYEKKTASKEVQGAVFSFFQPLCSMYIKSCKPSFLNWRSRLYFFTDASSLPRDSPTHCFGRAVQEAALAWRPHTSASLYLWSLQPLKSVNLWPLLLPDHILEHWSPAGQLQRWVPTPECPGTAQHVYPYVAAMVCLWYHALVVVSYRNCRWA